MESPAPCRSTSVSPVSRTRRRSHMSLPSWSVTCQRSPCWAWPGIAPPASRTSAAQSNALTTLLPSPAWRRPPPCASSSSWDACCRTCRERSCRAWCDGRLCPYRRSPFSVVRRPLLHAAHLQDAVELVRRCRHHREATHPDEPQIGERPVLLNLAQRHGLRQPPRGLQVHHRELWVFLFRVGIGLRHDLGHAHHGLLVSRVINQHPVARHHLPQMLEGEVVLDPVPDGCLLPLEVIVAVGGRLGLHDPVAAH